jgi:O-antigen/teichoic acid export membrane protein
LSDGRDDIGPSGPQSGADDSLEDMDRPDDEQVAKAQATRHAQHFAKQLSVLVSSGVVGYAGLLALNIVVARILGAEGFGAWAVAFSILRLVSGIGLVGSDWIVLRQGSYYQGVEDVPRLRQTIHFALAVGGCALLVVGLATFFLSDVIASQVLNAAGTAPLIRLAAVGGPVFGIRQILLCGTQTFKNMRYVALVNNFLQPVIRLALVGATLLFFDATRVALFAGLVAAEFVLAAAAAIALNGRVPLIGQTDTIPRRDLIHFAIPAWGSRLVETGRAEFYPLIVGALAGLSATGVLAAAQRITKAPNAINTSMNQVYIPMAGDLYLQGRRDELASLAKTIGKWTFTLGFPLFCVTVLFPEEVLALFGKAFSNGGPVLVVLAIGMLFRIGTGPVTTTLIVGGRSRLAFIDYVIVVATEVALMLLLIPRLGALGAAIASAVGVALNNLLPLLQVWRLLGFHVYRVEYWKPAAAGVVAVVVAWALIATVGIGSGVAAAITGIAVTGALYAVLLLSFGIDVDDRAAFGSIIGRIRRTDRAATASTR